MHFHNDKLHIQDVINLNDDSVLVIAIIVYPHQFNLIQLIQTMCLFNE